MKKTVYTLFVLLICGLFCLSGCGQIKVSDQIFETNAFRILRQVDANGKIGLSYIFPVNSKKLEELQFDDTDIKIYKFYLSTYVSTLADKYRESANNETKVSKCVYYTDIDGIGFTMEFNSLQAQKDFFGVKEDSENNSNTKNSGFFVKKMTVTTVFPVSNEETAKNLKEVCNLAITSWGVQNQIPQDKREAFSRLLEESIFIYDTSSPTNNLKSEIMYEGNGFKHNVFIKNQEEIKNNNQIEFFVTYPNVSVWYLVALLTVPLGMLCYYFVMKRKIVQ